MALVRVNPLRLWFDFSALPAVTMENADDSPTRTRCSASAGRYSASGRVVKTSKNPLAWLPLLRFFSLSILGVATTVDDNPSQPVF